MGPIDVHGEWQNDWRNADVYPYAMALRGKPQLWRTIVALMGAFAALGFTLGVLLMPLGAMIDTALGETPVTLAEFRITVGIWLAGSSLMAALIPISGALQWLIYGVSPRWLISVEGRFRLRWTAKASIVIVPVYLLAAGLVQYTRPASQWSFSPLTIALAMVALITTPLQSAGEEWLFRGLVARAMGARFARANLALGASLIVSTVFFWIGHGATQPVSIIYYLSAGTGLWFAAHWSGGLEAGSIMHACANTFVVIPAIFSGKLSSIDTPNEVVLLVSATVWLITPILIHMLAKRVQLVSEGDLPQNPRG